MSKRKKNIGIGLLISMVVLLVLSAVVYHFVFSPSVNNLAEKSTYLYIEKNDSYEDVFSQVSQKKITQNLKTFDYVSKVLSYKTHIKPGRYTLKPNMNIWKLVRLLRSGRQDEIKFTIKSYWQLEQFINYATERINIDTYHLTSLLNDEIFLTKNKIKKEEWMAYLIPETHHFYWNTSETELMDKLIKYHQKFWNEERKASAKEINLSPMEVSILASIVQKETSKVDEMPSVAGLYINRLNCGMKLQADPTVIFSLNDASIKRVYQKQTLVASAYNTYMITGLPPGPICVPSIVAIDAVLNKRDHNYLFMCAKEDFSGYHNFAVTYTEHQKNAKRYTNALNKRNIK